MSKEHRSLEEYLAKQEPMPTMPFRPCTIYNEALDNLEVYLSPEKTLMLWADEKMAVTVLKDDPNKVGGIVFHGWSRHLARTAKGSHLI